MHFVASLDKIDGMRCVLGLHETVVTATVDGYYRVLLPRCYTIHGGEYLLDGVCAQGRQAVPWQ